MKPTVALARPRGKGKGAGGQAREGRERRGGKPSEEEVTKGEVTALLEVLKEQALLHEAGRGPAAGGGVPSQGEGGLQGRQGRKRGAAEGEERPGGVGTGEGGGAAVGSKGGVQDTATALTEALAERGRRPTGGKQEGTGAKGAAGVESGGPKDTRNGKDAKRAQWGEQGKSGRWKGGEGGVRGGVPEGRRRRGRRTSPRRISTSAGCVGLGVMWRRITETPDVKGAPHHCGFEAGRELNNKTPLSLLNEFAMRNKIEVRMVQYSTLLYCTIHNSTELCQAQVSDFGFVLCHSPRSRVPFKVHPAR